VSETTSGAGGILSGTALGRDGSKSAGASDVIEELAPSSKNPNNGDSKDGAKSGAAKDEAAEAAQKREEAAFASAAQSLHQALQDMPELAELSKNIIVDETPEGLRIQLVDQEGRSMFNEGSAQPNDRAKLLLRAITKVINQLPNRISIYGHTSANANGKKNESDWPLSQGRADASRKVLQASGVDPDRVYQVSGKAGSEPLYPDDPTLPGNRRIAIVLLREAPVLPPDPGL
jgi:chemotaxis protein MotB